MTEEQYTNKVPWLKPYQYVPGESGNEGGRPKGTSITAELRKIIGEEGKAKQMAEALVSIAENPHSKYQLAALSLALDRTDGKVKDVIAVEGDVSAELLVKLLKQVETKEIEQPKELTE
ncbi:hypothetical protein LCGC14_1218500 [marine sediment metagenome]|uniref:DUF5681 domain-containing protein n=1 Tax=marine sediment metagenome TaxID=412755 RepID=A0A0F9LC05_9ZZZZ